MADGDNDECDNDGGDDYDDDGEEEGDGDDGEHHDSNDGDVSGMGCCYHPRSGHHDHHPHCKKLKLSSCSSDADQQHYNF